MEALWRWPRTVNPHLADVDQECLDWSASFGAFDPETHRRLHDHGKFSLPLLNQSTLCW
jgi:hypothetical protein